MTRVAAVETAKAGIRVIAMCPGLVKTPGHVGAAKEVDDFLLSTVPMGRWGVPEEITDGIIFLCSDMASFLTGTAFVSGSDSCQSLAQRVGNRWRVCSALRMCIVLSDNMHHCSSSPYTKGSFSQL